MLALSLFSVVTTITPGEKWGIRFAEICPFGFPNSGYFLDVAYLPPKKTSPIRSQWGMFEMMWMIFLLGLWGRLPTWRGWWHFYRCRGSGCWWIGLIIAGLEESHKGEADAESDRRNYYDSQERNPAITFQYRWRTRIYCDCRGGG